MPDSSASTTRTGTRDLAPRRPRRAVPVVLGVVVIGLGVVRGGILLGIDLVRGVILVVRPGDVHENGVRPPGRRGCSAVPPRAASMAASDRLRFMGGPLAVMSRWIQGYGSWAAWRPMAAPEASDPLIWDRNRVATYCSISASPSRTVPGPLRT